MAPVVIMKPPRPCVTPNPSDSASFSSAVSDTVRRPERRIRDCRGSLRSPGRFDDVGVAVSTPAAGALHGDDNFSPTYFGRAFFRYRPAPFSGAAILKSSSFLPVFNAAASHRGFSPRPAHVSSGLSGLRYFGATAPRRAPRTPLPRDPFARRSNLLSWS
jgi:hypothetical protein